MSKNTVKIKDYSKINLELEAESTLRAGMILELDSDNKVKPHSGAGENALPYVALEDELQGNEIGDEYSADDPVQVWIPGKGCEAQLLLGNAQNISIGDLLESEGNGKLVKHTPGQYGFGKQVVGQALEAKNTQGAETEAWIIVRIF